MNATTAVIVNNGGKIQGHHRDRLAIVYVRQSTLQQVERHQESTRLQYGLAQQLQSLGWAASQVMTIDDDLGKSAASAEHRLGFQRLVTEVSLDHVGIIMGIEMSRLARSNRDWHQLLEVCALFRTLIGDLDGIYDPTDYNDRLILGLKGTMSEAELHVLKQRLLVGKRAKAERGELGKRVPMGYVRHGGGIVIKDPDQQVQAIVTLIFDQYERCGSVNGVLQYLITHQIQLPCRADSGVTQGELEWRRPQRTRISDMLRNPIYAGAYAYGRRLSDPKAGHGSDTAKTHRVSQPEALPVLLKDRLPAYISWARFERNQRQLANSRGIALGTARYGPSLLSGLLRCGHCGARMNTHYNHRGRFLRYSCDRHTSTYGTPRCQSLAGAALDEAVSALVLQALQPAALEISLQVADDLEQERQQRHQQWRQRLARAQFETTRAARQYHAVEPENRLVARTLETQWEHALAHEQRLQTDYKRFLSTQPARLTDAERSAIRRIAHDIPTLWHAPTTTPADRQTIIRQLIEQIRVTLYGESEKIDVQIHWAGGHTTQTTLIRPVARWEQLSYYPALSARVVQLHQHGESAAAIAKTLNAEGWRPPTLRGTINSATVATLLNRKGMASSCQRLPLVEYRGKNNEWTLPELSRELRIPQPTLYLWLRKGRIRGRKRGIGSYRIWVIEANQADLERLRRQRLESYAAASKQSS